MTASLLGDLDRQVQRRAWAYIERGCGTHDDPVGEACAKAVHRYASASFHALSPADQRQRLLDAGCIRGPNGEYIGRTR